MAIRPILYFDDLECTGTEERLIDCHYRRRANLPLYWPLAAARCLQGMFSNYSYEINVIKINDGYTIFEIHFWVKFGTVKEMLV